MGVRDFIFLLQKSCPGVIKELPNRLYDLKGKTIIIDGTLFTQRLHFARIPFENRHVLGWHRLVMDMKDAGVTAICVFDSKGRPIAKQRELYRRQARTRLEEARATMEHERLARLRRFLSALSAFQTIPLDEQAQILVDIRARLPSVEASSLLTNQSSTEGETSRGLQNPKWPVKYDKQQIDSVEDCSSDPKSRHSSLQYEESAAALDDHEKDRRRSLDFNPIGTEIERSSQDRRSKAFRVIVEEQISGSKAIGQTGPDIQCVISNQNASRFNFSHISSEVEFLINEMTQLFCDYIANGQPGPPAAHELSASQSASSFEVKNELENVYRMSKAQLVLVQAEKSLWQQLLQPRFGLEDHSPAVADYSGPIEDGLTELTRRSESLLDMFERRRPPKPESYEDCKTILRAMGVPCLESPTFIGGEAFAAALVNNGFGDYVASEDTDVIVHEAPLIRSLGNKKGTLTQVAGAEARHALNLERNSFVDLALLCGTDFTSRIKNIGPVTALKLIRKYGSIENLVQDPIAHPLPVADYLDEIQAAREVFSSPVPLPPKQTLEQGHFDEQKVQSLLTHFGLAHVTSTNWDYSPLSDSSLDGISSDLSFGESQSHNDWKNDVCGETTSFSDCIPMDHDFEAPAS